MKNLALSRRRVAVAACVWLASLVDVTPAAASVVRFTTNLGIFDVNLSTSGSLATTVDNFLAYVTSTAYAGSFIHRSTTYNASLIQIVQGGGFTLQGNAIYPIPALAPIPLQAGVANTRGTIAMARTSEPNSATSGWYFNVTDNPDLDYNYAVFGNVIDTTDHPGMTVVDAIGDVPVYNASATLGGAFGELPLLQPSLAPQNLVVVQGVAILSPASSITIGVGTGTSVTQLQTGYPVLSGTVPVLKTGGGTLVGGGSNAATGPLEIRAGSFVAPARATLASFDALAVAAGATLDVSALAGGYAVPGGQTLSGNGTVLGSVSFGAGATLSPGSSSPSASASVAAVPEPASIGMLGVGLAGLASLATLRSGRLGAWRFRARTSASRPGRPRAA